MTGSISDGPRYTSVSALGIPARAIILYRLLRGTPDLADEFDSYAKIGQRSRFPLAGDQLARWGATSMYDMHEDARNVAQAMRASGRSVVGIAEIHVPTNGWFPMQQTGQNRHHWSVWGDTEHMATFLVTIHSA